MLTGNAKSGIVSRRGMTDNTSKPHMTDTHLYHILEHLGGEVCHLTAAVLPNGSILLPCGITITIQPGENLIDDDLLHLYSSSLPSYFLHLTSNSLLDAVGGYFLVDLANHTL